MVASTNRDLEQAVREGKFREDLFYSLSVIPIQIPPLRERKEDIPLLVDHFIQRYNTQFRKNVTRVTPEGLKLMMNYSWPGNIRELKNAIERAMILVDSDTHRRGSAPHSDFRPAGSGPGTRPGENHQVRLPPKALAWTTSKRPYSAGAPVCQWQQDHGLQTPQDQPGYAAVQSEEAQPGVGRSAQDIIARLEPGGTPH